MENIQKTGLNRNLIDKYYTKENVVITCISLVKNNINITENDLIIEPSAGNGSFIKEIQKLNKNYLFYDLEPENDLIIKQDFLSINILDYNNFKNIHIIGNPPFGRQSSLAIKFIKKCCKFASSISFILPKSFKKNTMQKYFHINYHLKTQIDLSRNSFLVNDKEFDVPCIFQIWIRDNSIKRENIFNINPFNFKFVKYQKEADISFRRIGYNAGHISKNITNKSIQSHYFIKFLSNKIDDNLLQKLKSIKFDTDNTVGPKSISKPEIIIEFNKILKNLSTSPDFYNR
jgi:hypothetical protein